MAEAIVKTAIAFSASFAEEAQSYHALLHTRQFCYHGNRFGGEAALQLHVQNSIKLSR
jgi:hypothetical protein